MADNVDTQQWEEVPEDHPLAKALRASREAERKARSEARLLKIQSQYPTMGYLAGDFEGIDPDKWEQVAERLAAKAQAHRQAVDTPNPAPHDSDSRVPEGITRMGLDGLEGLPPTNANSKTLNLEEAKALYRRSPAEYERLKAAGLIDLGVKMIDKGGSIIFEAK